MLVCDAVRCGFVSDVDFVLQKSDAAAWRTGGHFGVLEKSHSGRHLTLAHS